ncbi:OmpA family protein [Nevskia sp.]|uniref:OmpA family protein n=1 Tax=Nevskia sp. TaxID=1929292 RepID=UPI0025E717DF|nr:OmpA family protein [Nevskia sp.]
MRAALFGLALLPGVCTAGVPLVEGLTVTTAIAGPAGDYESRKRLAGREGDGWRLRYSASVPGDAGRPRSIDSERLLHDADLLAAHTYRSRFEADTDEDYPGTTALGASVQVLAELKAAGKSRFALVGEDHWMADALAAMPGAQESAIGLAAALMANPGASYKGELARRSAGTLSVLVNGQISSLPVIVAGGRFTAKSGQTLDAELSLLDDANNPITLQWRIGTASLRVVRIDFPVPDNKQLGETLKAKKRVTLPGLFFDFGSAMLKPESAAAVRTIAEAAGEAPGTLTLEGHTDIVGDTAKNLALSRARAESVRAALISINPELAARLSAQGYGATRPQAANTTLEGRAQNRRVELVAQ